MVYARITEVLSASLNSLSDYSLVFLKVDRRYEDLKLPLGREERGWDDAFERVAARLGGLILTKSFTLWTSKVVWLSKLLIF
jgi:hypothetical protein